jgi:cytochrome P450
MPGTLAKLGWLDNLRLNLFHALPLFLLGLFKRCPFFSWLFVRLGIHPYNPRWGQRLRRRYGSNYLHARILFRPTLLVLDPEGIARVLERSPSVYGESALKVRGMSHWQPGAVTISEGARWQQRRAFNEAVLSTGQAIPPQAKAFLHAAHEAVEEAVPTTWRNLSRIHDALAQRVVFGAASEAHGAAFQSLWALMNQANRLLWLKPNRHFARLMATTRQAVQHPEGDGLTARCPHAPQDPKTGPEHQVPHWMFAIGNTLAENVIRALWLIASHPQAERKVRAELDGKDLMDPEQVAGLTYLEGCIQEAMRLYPTTAVIARRMRRRDSLGGQEVAPGTQVLIPNNFLHRDAETVEDADAFRPERWPEAADDYRFNPLSHGPKGCAGRELVLFLAKALVAVLLRRHRIQVRRPVIDPARPLPLGNDSFRIELTLGDAG